MKVISWNVQDLSLYKDNVVWLCRTLKNLDHCFFAKIQDWRFYTWIGSFAYISAHKEENLKGWHRMKLSASLSNYWVGNRPNLNIALDVAAPR